MDDDWYDGYDGGMYSGGGTKGRKRKTKIPRFKSIVRKGHRGKRSRRGKVSDSETTIVMWVVITALVSAVFHAEWIFATLYALFVVYTLKTKDIWPIRYVSTILTSIGILFFVALGLAVLVNLMVDHNLLQDPATRTAYGYIFKVPLLSWSIVWMIENGMEWKKNRKFAKASFIEKQKSHKLLLQKITALCHIAPIVIVLVGGLYIVYTVFQWGFWGLSMFSLIQSWTTPWIIGISLLGKGLERLEK